MRRFRPVRTAVVAAALALASILGACAASDTTESQAPATSTPAPSGTARGATNPDADDSPTDTSSTGMSTTFDVDSEELLRILETELAEVETASVNKVGVSSTGQQTVDTVFDYTRTPLAAQALYYDGDNADALTFIMVDNLTYADVSRAVPGKWFVQTGYPADIVDPIAYLQDVVAGDAQSLNAGAYVNRGETVTMYGASVEMKANPEADPVLTSWEIYLDAEGSLTAFKFYTALESSLVRVDDLEEPPVIEAPPVDDQLSDEEARAMGLLS